MNRKNFFIFLILFSTCLTLTCVIYVSKLKLGIKRFLLFNGYKSYMKLNLTAVHHSRQTIASACFPIINGVKNSSITKSPLRTSNDVILKRAGRDCWNVISNYSFNYNWRKISREEENYPIAYSILAHHKTEQLLLLLAEIYSPQNAYCIHIDKKAPSSMVKAVEAVIKCLPNVLLASKIEDVVYASYSRLQADINCMEDLLKSKVQWNHLINLCGQDFPIKTNLEIVRILKQLKGRNRIASHKQENKWELRRTKFVHKITDFKSKGKSYSKISRTKSTKSPPPFNLTVMKNLAYNVYSRQFLQWALFKSDKAKALLQWSRDTKTPDEHYWSMLELLGEAPGKTEIKSTNWSLSFVIWRKSRTPCFGYWLHYSCVFGKDDVSNVVQQPKLFANKFDVEDDRIPLMCVREWLREKRKREVT